MQENASFRLLALLGYARQVRVKGVLGGRAMGIDCRSDEPPTMREYKYKNEIIAFFFTFC